MKRALVKVVIMLIISGFLLFIGYILDIKILMFSYYEETSFGREAGGSILPFLIGAISSYFIDKIFYKKQVTN